MRGMMRLALLGVPGTKSSRTRWTPDLIDNMILRLDHTTPVYQDEAGTVSANTHGQQVLHWSNGIVGGVNATANNTDTGGRGALLYTGESGLGGKNCFYFNGTKTGFVLSGLSVAASPVTAYFVIHPDSASGTFRYLLWSAQLVFAANGDSDGRVGYYDGIGFKNIADAVAAAQILTFVLGAAGGEVFRDGVSIGTGAFTQRAITTASLAAQATGESIQANFVGRMGACYLYAGAHDASQREAVEEYLADAFF